MKPKFPTVAALTIKAEEAYCKRGLTRASRLHRREFLADCRPMRLTIRAIVTTVRAEMVKGMK